jgi:flavorubredoxin
MALLIMYDTFYGNTERVANLISDGLREKGQEVICRCQSVSGEEDFMGVRFWVLGSPTRWGRPTFRFKTMLRNAVKDAGADHDFVVFDTRFSEVHSGAADRLHLLLTKSGLRPLMPPQSFIVEGRELRPDQEEKALELGRTIAALL